MRFDEFIMERMGYPWGENEPDKQTRRQAFLVFRQRTGRVDFASLPTMHRWFGLEKYHKPSRQAVFQMAFAMGLDREETKQYLMVGIGEPSFYVNDYQEMIYLYGIDHKKSMEQCEKMIAFYEENLEDNVVISHTRSTRELMNAYEGTLDFSTEEFLWWMGGRADWFKGYSQTALNYVKQYRDSILSWVRDEEKKRLDELLAEVNFPAWQQVHGAAAYAGGYLGTCEVGLCDKTVQCKVFVRGLWRQLTLCEALFGFVSWSDSEGTVNPCGTGEKTATVSA